MEPQSGPRERLIKLICQRCGCYATAKLGTFADYVPRRGGKLPKVSECSKYGVCPCHTGIGHLPNVTVTDA